MMRILAIAVLVLSATSIALGQKQSGSRDHRTSIEQAIRQLNTERIQAQIDANGAALKRIYADDFIGVGPSGTVRTKPQVISDFTSGDLKFQSITTEEVQGYASTGRQPWRLASPQWLDRTEAKPSPVTLGLPGFG